MMWLILLSNMVVATSRRVDFEDQLKITLELIPNFAQETWRYIGPDVELCVEHFNEHNILRLGFKSDTRWNKEMLEGMVQNPDQILNNIYMRCRGKLFKERLGFYKEAIKRSLDFLAALKEFTEIRCYNWQTNPVDKMRETFLEYDVKLGDSFNVRNEEETLNIASSFELCHTEQHCYRIKKEAALQIIGKTEDGVWLRQENNGRNFTKRINQVFFKRIFGPCSGESEEAMFDRELMSIEFYQAIGMPEEYFVFPILLYIEDTQTPSSPSGTPLNSSFHIGQATGIEQKNYCLIQVSRYAGSDNLLKKLTEEKNFKPPLFNFSWHFIVDVLCNQYDRKLDNYIVDAAGCLVAIDLDHSLDETFPVVRNETFVKWQDDYMNEPFDIDVWNHLQNIDPSQLVQQWSHGCINHPLNWWGQHLRTLKSSIRVLVYPPQITIARVKKQFETLKRSLSESLASHKKTLRHKELLKCLYSQEALTFHEPDLEVNLGRIPCQLIGSVNFNNFTKILLQDVSGDSVEALQELLNARNTLMSLEELVIHGENGIRTQLALKSHGRRSLRNIELKNLQVSCCDISSDQILEIDVSHSHVSHEVLFFFLIREKQEPVIMKVHLLEITTDAGVFLHPSKNYADFEIVNCDFSNCSFICFHSNFQNVAFRYSKIGLLNCSESWMNKVDFYLSEFTKGMVLNWTKLYNVFFMDKAQSCREISCTNNKEAQNVLFNTQEIGLSITRVLTANYADEYGVPI